MVQLLVHVAWVVEQAWLSSVVQVSLPHAEKQRRPKVRIKADFMRSLLALVLAPVNRDGDHRQPRSPGRHSSSPRPASTAAWRPMTNSQSDSRFTNVSTSAR